MSDSQRACCTNCAFMADSNRKMWCKFHDCAVSTRTVCDDFINEMDSPTSIGLMEDIAANGREDPRSRNTAWDIFYGVSTIILLFCPWLALFACYMALTH